MDEVAVLVEKVMPVEESQGVACTGTEEKVTGLARSSAFTWSESSAHRAESRVSWVSPEKAVQHPTNIHPKSCFVNRHLELGLGCGSGRGLAQHMRGPRFHPQDPPKQNKNTNLEMKKILIFFVN